MFGYIRPLAGELKLYEHERFRACYCGLCHALGGKYGLPARFILNYELVFLSMLLWDENEPLNIRRGRCAASPCRRKRYCGRNAALDTCAGYSVILTWWKLRDTIADESFIKAVPHRIGALTLSGAYRKASREFPEFDGVVREELASLSQYEEERADSLDRGADKFARILAAAIPDDMPGDKRRPMKELLYHTGRWIYIIDAYDDYNGDIEAKRYNPLTARFSTDFSKLSDESIERLKTTITHSNNLACRAFELAPENIWTETIRNIIYLGMPDICERVLAGKWPPKRKRNGNDI